MLSSPHCFGSRPAGSTERLTEQRSVTAKNPSVRHQVTMQEFDNWVKRFNVSQVAEAISGGFCAPVDFVG
jgi:hypothetical protein